MLYILITFPFTIDIRYHKRLYNVKKMFLMLFLSCFICKKNYVLYILNIKIIIINVKRFIFFLKILNIINCFKVSSAFSVLIKTSIFITQYVRIMQRDIDQRMESSTNLALPLSAEINLLRCSRFQCSIKIPSASSCKYADF